MAALLGAAVVALLPGEVADAAPLVTAVASLSCPSGAVCDGTVDFTPGLHSTDVVVACSVEDLPTLLGKVLVTSVICELTGADGVVYSTQANSAPAPAPAVVATSLFNLPLQSYRVCVEGQYVLLNHTVVTSGFVCNTGGAPPL